MGVAQQLSRVVPLERLGELVEEVDERGGGLIGQLDRQADDRQIIRLHGVQLLRRVFLAARSAAVCAARSLASLRR